MVNMYPIGHKTNSQVSLQRIKVMRLKFVFAFMIGFGLTYSGPIDFTTLSAGTSVFLGVGSAKAQNPQRNTARRTARRTTRRVNYRQSVAGCTPYNAYYNCGGVYYQAVVQDGATVYIVVNP